MALFKKKAEEKKIDLPVEVKNKEIQPLMSSSRSDLTPIGPRVSSKKHTGAILLSPRITEKGSYGMEEGVYVFNVSKNANKRDIARAVTELFKVEPIQIRVTQIPSKRVVSRSGIRGKTASGKKAYVYLKKGEKIEII